MKDASRLLLHFRPFLKPHCTSYVLVFVLLATEAVLTLVQPVLYQHLIDDVLGGRSGAAGVRLLVFYLSVLGTLRIAAGLAGVFRQIRQARVLQGMTMDLENTVYRRLEALPAAYHDRHAPGESLRHLYGDPGRVTAFLVDLAPAAIESAVRGLAALVVITTALWWAGPLALAPLPLLAWLSLRGGRRFEQLSQLSFGRSKRLYLHVLDSLRGIRLMRVFGRLDEERDRFERLQRRYRDTQLAQSVYGAWFSPSLSAVSRLGGLAVFVAGALAVVLARTTDPDGFTLGKLFMLMGYVWQLAQPMARLGHLAGESGQIVAAARRLRSILDEPLEAAAIAPAAGGDPADTTIAFEHVTFGYRPGHAVLRDVSLTIRPGDIVGLAGVNGSGKTTLAHLLCGLYRPQEGRVLIGGRCAEAAVAQTGPRLVALAPQDAPLFQRTIRQNLGLGRRDIPEAELRATIELVGMTAAVDQLPRGLDTRVGEGADQLSAGQRQRLSLARALLSAAPILVLDEAMSWIDTEDRKRIWERLRRLEPRPTLIIISHHENVVREVDRLLVVADGRVTDAPAGTGIAL